MKHSILGYPLFSDKDISSYGGFLNSGDPKKWSIVIGCSIINHKPSILRSVPPFIEPPKNWIIAGQNSQPGKSRRNRAACPTLPWAQRPARLRLMEKLGICRIPETRSELLHVFHAGKPRLASCLSCFGITVRITILSLDISEVVAGHPGSSVPMILAPCRSEIFEGLQSDFQPSPVSRIHWKRTMFGQCFAAFSWVLLHRSLTFRSWLEPWSLALETRPVCRWQCGTIQQQWPDMHNIENIKYQNVITYLTVLQWKIIYVQFGGRLEKNIYGIKIYGIW